jgi:hypothetical protein
MAERCVLALRALPSEAMWALETFGPPYAGALHLPDCLLESGYGLGDRSEVVAVGVCHMGSVPALLHCPWGSHVWSAGKLFSRVRLRIPNWNGYRRNCAPAINYFPCTSSTHVRLAQLVC